MIGTNGATDEFIVVARFETMISTSRCLYMANAIQLGSPERSGLLVGTRSPPRLPCDLRGQSFYKDCAEFRLAAKIRMYL